MAAHQLKRITLAFSLLISSSAYSADCSHCDSNDKLTETSAENSLGTNGDLIAQLQQRLQNNQNTPRHKTPLGKLKSEHHRKMLCAAWGDQDWTRFKGYLTEWNYKAKDIYYDLKCNIGPELGIPLFHVATHSPTLYKVIYQRLIREMHKEGGNDITSCAITQIRYQNTTLLFDELATRLEYTKRVLAKTTDQAILAKKETFLKNYEKMRKKFQAHIDKYPVKDPSKCPNWAKK